MKTLLTVCCLGLAVWAQTAASSAQLSPLDQKLIANAKAVLQAEKDKNVTFLSQTLAPDFVAVGSEGKLHDRSEILESAQSGELHDFSAYNFRVLPVHEGVVLVTYDCVIHMPEGDAPGMAPRYQHLSDLWVKEGDEWRLRFQQATAARPVD
jgi:hypothetical protein